MPTENSGHTGIYSFIFAHIFPVIPDILKGKFFFLAGRTKIHSKSWSQWKDQLNRMQRSVPETIQEVIELTGFLCFLFRSTPRCRTNSAQHICFTMGWYWTNLLWLCYTFESYIWSRHWNTCNVKRICFTMQIPDTCSYWPMCTKGFDWRGTTHHVTIPQTVTLLQFLWCYSESSNPSVMLLWCCSEP